MDFWSRICSSRKYLKRAFIATECSNHKCRLQFLKHHMFTPPQRSSGNATLTKIRIPESSSCGHAYFTQADILFQYGCNRNCYSVYICRYAFQKEMSQPPLKVLCKGQSVFYFACNTQLTNTLVCIGPRVSLDCSCQHRASRLHAHPVPFPLGASHSFLAAMICRGSGLASTTLQGSQGSLGLRCQQEAGSFLLVRILAEPLQCPAACMPVFYNLTCSQTSAKGRNILTWHHR